MVRRCVQKVMRVMLRNTSLFYHKVIDARLFMQICCLLNILHIYLEPSQKTSWYIEGLMLEKILQTELIKRISLEF